MRRLIYLAPLAVVLALGYFLYDGLSGDPRRIPSPLIGKPAPAFDLPALAGRQPAPHGKPGGLSSADLAKGKPVVVNVWAPWCIPCIAEHPLIDRLAQEGAIVHGINYRDQSKAASDWLARLGDPYTLIGADIEGRASLDWGVYGVPETFVIDGDGIVQFKHAGAVTPEILEKQILPLLKGEGS